MSEYPAAFVKRPHMKGCDGDLIRQDERVYVDRTGRIGNGGIITHDYRCNRRHWAGCEARVLVTERAVRLIALSVEKRR